MSKQDVELVKGVYDAFGRGDIPTVLAALDADVEWIEPGGGRAPSGTLRGVDSVASEVFGPSVIPGHFDEFKVTPQDFIDARDAVVVTGRYTGRSKSGTALDAPFCAVWQIRDGKLARYQNYTDSEPWTRAWS